MKEALIAFLSPALGSFLGVIPFTLSFAIPFIVETSVLTGVPSRLEILDNDDSTVDDAALSTVEGTDKLLS